MASWYTNRHDTKDKRKADLQRIRELGYDHGYSGRLAITSELTYQQAYKRGCEARRAEDKLG